MENTNTSSENLAEALKLLDEAAKQKKNELRTAMADKYMYLKNLVMENESCFAKSLADAKTHVAEVAIHAKDVSAEKARELAVDVDKNVHLNPWAYIGGTAVIGLLFGYLLGRNRK